MLVIVSLCLSIFTCAGEKRQILLSLPEQKQISYAEQSENFATDVPAAFSHWVIDHLVDLHQTPPMAASMIFSTRNSRFPTQPELLVGFATRDSRANVNWRNVVHIRSVARKESIDNTKNIKTYPSLSINLLFTCKYIRMNHFVEHLIIRWVYLKDCDKDFEKPVLSHFLAGALSAD